MEAKKKIPATKEYSVDIFGSDNQFLRRRVDFQDADDAREYIKALMEYNEKNLLEGEDKEHALVRVTEYDKYDNEIQSYYMT